MRQLALTLEKPRRRRRRARSGVVPRADRPRFVPHRTRPAHDHRHPVHVTIGRVRLGPSFRAERIRAVILRELACARAKGVRVVQYSLQDDHIHLMVEGADAGDLSAQMRKLFSRIAMAVNHVAMRRGSLFRDRHHRHALTTPREVRNALVYILFNARKHEPRVAAEAQALYDAPDPCSSAPWFRGWAEGAQPPGDVANAMRLREHLPAEPPLSVPGTWLANVGWKRAGGAIRFDERPRRR